MMKNSISGNTVVVATENQVSCHLDGEVVILMLDDGTYYGLNTVGASIWNLIQQPETVEGIRNRLLEEYDVDPEQCAAELKELLEELRNRGIVETRNGSVA